MIHQTEHKTFKLIAVLLLVAFILPSAVKFTHAFNHHQHEICLGDATTHLHKYDADCNFYKFQVNKNFTLSNFEAGFFIEKEINAQITKPYAFLSDYQQLHFSLRGPPVQV